MAGQKQNTHLIPVGCSPLETKQNHLDWPLNPKGVAKLIGGEGIRDDRNSEGACCIRLSLP